jgi:hypothetical protein
MGSPRRCGGCRHTPTRRRRSGLLEVAEQVTNPASPLVGDRRRGDMAYDEDLAGRVREQLAAEPAVTEKAMFGGLAFLLHGNTAVGLSGQELMVRVGPEASDDALAHPHTRPFDMTGRPMKGWVLVAPDGVAGESDLATWVARGVRFARSLRAKD